MADRPVVCRVALGHGRLMLYSRHLQTDVPVQALHPLAGGLSAELTDPAARALHKALGIALGMAEPPPDPDPEPVERYGDWFAALGNPIPAGNRMHLFDYLTGPELMRNADEASLCVALVARAVEKDQPDEALRILRGTLGRDETAVMRACAVLCCPPTPADTEDPDAPTAPA